MVNERYKCCRCKHKFVAPRGMTVCPKCDSLYVRWLTYNPDEVSKILQPQSDTKSEETGTLNGGVPNEKDFSV